MTKKQNYPLVEVHWLDSASTPGWQEEFSTEPLECWSAGYLIHKDRRSVVVALNCSSENSNHAGGDAITIPAKVVLKVRRLR